MSVLRCAAGVFLVAVLFNIRTSASENWTRFRGPNGLGVSGATNLPVEFGPDKNVRWKTALPPGHSSPVFTNTHIFVSAHSPEREAHKLFGLALDRKTGTLLWQREVPREHPGRLEQVNGPASPSPVTDGANGAMVRVKDERFALPTLSVSAVATIGCGDAYFALSSLASCLRQPARTVALAGSIGAAALALQKADA